MKIRPGLFINDAAIEENFTTAGGPGGQNVNKVSTAVQLRVDLQKSSLPDAVVKRLQQTAGNRITNQGILIIDAREHRSREQNRRRARQRLVAIVRGAARRPKRRIQTRPPQSANRRRIEKKRRRGAKKRNRNRRWGPDD